MPTLYPGQLVFFRYTGNEYWCGRYDQNAFMFLLGNAKRIPIEDAMSYLRAAFIMNEVNEEDDFFMQGELPF